MYGVLILSLRRTQTGMLMHHLLELIDGSFRLNGTRTALGANIIEAVPALLVLVQAQNPRPLHVPTSSA